MNPAPRRPRVERLTGAAMLPLLAQLARLRMGVFRDWPYLYAGDEAYEQAYLQTYARSPRAMLAVVRDGDEIVGASTCLPLADETAEIAQPFRDLGLDPAAWFYFGESVLLPAWRGQGLGAAFFEAREAHARDDGQCDFAAFCSVRRAADHPARPADWVPLDGFWRRRGFVPARGLSCRLAWRETGAEHDSTHTLDFWAKPLRDRPLPPILA